MGEKKKSKSKPKSKPKPKSKSNSSETNSDKDNDKDEDKDENKDEDKDKSSEGEDENKEKIKLKSKVDKKESEEEEKKTKKKKKSKLKEEETEEDKKKESEVKSEVISTIDVEKAELDVEDPMKDDKRLKITKKCISHLCLVVLVLAVKNVFVGVVAKFYEHKTHLIIFGGLCIMQLFGAPIGWLAIRMGNRLLFLICFTINCIWLICVTILLLFYWISGDHYFKQEIGLHVGAIFFMSASIVLGICCLLMMKRLDMINLAFKKPEVYISADGKASEKAAKAKLKAKK